MRRTGGATQFAILGLLSIEPMSGYDVHREIKEALGFFWQESEGQIYPTLKQLTANGHISAVQTTKENARKRQLYAITASGRKLLRNWIAEEPREQPRRDEFQLKILLMRYGPPGAVLEHIRRHKEELMARLARAGRLKKSLMPDAAYPDFPVWMALFRFAELVREAEVTWCDEMLQTLSAVQVTTKPARKKRARE